jgi:hypothetical protein
MNPTIAKILGAGTLALASAATLAAPVVMSNATQVLNLAGANNCTQMGVAYDPAINQYYGGGGGHPGCNGMVWNASGALIQNVSPINIDVRGVNYNANSGQIEIVSYGAAFGYGGLVQMGRDSAGLYTTSNSLLLQQVAGMADGQSVAAYDSARDVFYSTVNRSGIVNIARHSDGGLAGTIALSGHSLSNTTYYSIGYDTLNDVLITFDAAAGQALVFGRSGAFIGASQLSGSGYDNRYAMSYANGMLFVGKSASGRGYDGYRILEAATAEVPEPAGIALVFLGLLAAFSVRRMRRG